MEKIGVSLRGAEMTVGLMARAGLQLCEHNDVIVVGSCAGGGTLVHTGAVAQADPAARTRHPPAV
jgi:hypothetical protein